MIWQAVPAASAFGRVAVLMGGTAAERDISLQSGQAVFQALQNNGVDVIAIDLGTQAAATLVQHDFDRAFVIVHGRGGEDGALQGVLQHLNKPYTGSGVTGSALAMHKVLTKQILQAHQLPTAAFETVASLSAAKAAFERLTQAASAAMVKPVQEGSSFGISKVQTIDELDAAWETASRYGDVFMEAFITGHEYTVGIVHGQALPLIQLKPENGFYDYAAKYERNDTQYLAADLPRAVQKHMQQVALTAFDALQLSGWARIDFMLQGDQPYIIEANTVPGMTDHSLIPMAARMAGCDFDALVMQLLMTSMAEVTHG